MQIYIAIAIALFVLATTEALWPKLARPAGTAALLIVTIFAALRYETGYDWFEYETFFEQAVTFDAALRDGIPEPDIPMEPLYVALNMVVKSLGGDFLLLVAVTATLSCWWIHAATRRISQSQAAMWLVFFGIAYLIIEFATIRQALATGVLLASFAASASRQFLRAAVLMAVAIGFHAFSAIYIPIIALAAWRPSRTLVAGFVGLGLLFIGLQVQPVNAIISAISAYVPDFVAAKLVFYDVDPAPLSMGALGLITLHLALGTAYLLAINDEEKRDPFVNVAIWLTLYVLGAHLYLSGSPVFWNRVMCVTLPWQICTLFRLNAVRALSRPSKLTIISALAALSFSALLTLLTKAESLRYIPYHSMLHVWFWDDKGDGRKRADDWQDQFGADAQK